MAVVFVLELVAGQDRLSGVDDDDMIAAINIGGKDGLVLAAQQCGGKGSGLLAASSTYHSRLMSSTFGRKVDIRVVTSLEFLILLQVLFHYSGPVFDCQAFF